jgi:four helix bundle protein
LASLECDERDAGESLIIFHFSFDISHWSFASKQSMEPYKANMEKKDEINEKQSPSRADALEQRLIDFAVRIVKLASRLPKTPAGKHIAGQILRSGTSPAPNYGEARGAESHADFVHKVRIVLKELNETSIWLHVIERSRILKPELLTEIIQENNELCRIFTTSLKTARKRTNVK